MIPPILFLAISIPGVWGSAPVRNLHERLA